MISMLRDLIHKVRQHTITDGFMQAERLKSLERNKKNARDKITVSEMKYAFDRVVGRQKKV